MQPAPCQADLTKREYALPCIRLTYYLSHQLYIKSSYGRILERIDVKLHSNERELARRMLEWVLSSTRPLRLKELEQAMTIRIGDRCINKRRRILRRLDELCGPILEIGVDEKVHFVHFSAKE